MKRIASLLNQKNHYLEKFYSLNEKEMAKFLTGQFDQIEAFYDTREKILEVLKYVDSEIEKAQHAAVNQDQPQIRNLIRESLIIKEQYVEKIIEQDIQILACIEGAKNNIIKELQEVRKAKKAINGYKAAPLTK